MYQKRDTSVAVVLAVAYVILLFDFPFGFGITSNRIGVALLIFGYVMKPGVPKVFGLQKALVTMCLSVLVLSTLWLSVSFVFSKHGSLTTITPVVSSLLITITFATSFVLANRMSLFGWDTLCRIIAVASAVIAVGTIVLIMSRVGVGGMWNQYLIRSSLEHVGPGLNRIMNGIVILSLFSFGIAVGVIKMDSSTRMVSIVGCLATVVLVVLSGSRQSAIAIVAMLLLYVIMARRTGAYASKVLVSVVLLGLMGAVVIHLFDLGLLVEQRFVSTLAGDSLSDSDASRLWIATTGLDHIFSSPWIGLGPGVFPNLEGMYTHNGHISLGVDAGLPILVLWWLMFSVLVVTMYARGRKAKGRENNLTLVFMISIIMIVFVMSLFNDLLRDHMLWVSIACGIGLLNTHKYLDCIRVSSLRPGSEAVVEDGV